MRFLRRLRGRWLDARLELNQTVLDFFESRHKTLLRRKENLVVRDGAKVKLLPGEVMKPLKSVRRRVK